MQSFIGTFLLASYSGMPRRSVPYSPEPVWGLPTVYIPGPEVADVVQTMWSQLQDRPNRGHQQGTMQV